GFGGSATEAIAPGHFPLVSIDGGTLPVTTHTLVTIPTDPSKPSVRCDDQIVSSSFTLNGGGSATRTTTRQMSCNDGSHPPATIESEAGSFTTSGAEFRVTLTSAVNATITLTRVVYVRHDGANLVAYRTEET